MGILDDAIREHLDLKRKHGARDAELREIEDEALGSGDQPDPFVAGELFSEVASTGTAEAGGEEATRVVDPEALRPQAPPPEPEPETSDEPISPPEGLEPVPGQAELPGQDEVPGQERLDEEPESYRPTEPEPERYRPTEPEPESQGSAEEDAPAQAPDLP